MYYVYILASGRPGTLYIGVTNSLQKGSINIATAKAVSKRLLPARSN
jgi:predicted GIY-YIG superfamily endonuclease